MIDGATFFAEAQSENEFMKNVLAYAKKRNWLTYHTHISKRSTEGFPDLCMVRDGRIVFAELKREKGGRVSPAQRQWLDELGRVTGTVAGVLHGGDWITAGVDHNRLMCPEAVAIVGVYLWRPSDWPEIEKVLA